MIPYPRRSECYGRKRLFLKNRSTLTLFSFVPEAVDSPQFDEVRFCLSDRSGIPDYWSISIARNIIETPFMERFRKLYKKHLFWFQASSYDCN